MIILMRTTLNIDDELVQQAKHEAVDRRMSLSEFVSRALTEALRTSRSERSTTPFRMVVHGPASPRVNHQPVDFNSGASVGRNPQNP